MTDRLAELEVTIRDGLPNRHVIAANRMCLCGFCLERRATTAALAELVEIARRQERVVEAATYYYMLVLPSSDEEEQGARDELGAALDDLTAGVAHCQRGDESTKCGIDALVARAVRAEAVVEAARKLLREKEAHDRLGGGSFRGPFHPLSRAVREFDARSEA